MLCYRCGSHNPDGSKDCSGCGQHFAQQARTVTAARKPVGVTTPKGAPFNKGDVLSHRFEVLELIGGGPSGHVYRARDTDVPRGGEPYVALKSVHPRFMQTPDDVAQLVRSLGRAKKMLHPNVARVLHHAEHDGITYVVSQFVPGTTLANIVAQRRGDKRFTLDECEPIVSQIVAALEYAHRFTAHGALKPQNVIVQPGELRVTDFTMMRGLPRRPYLAGVGEAIHYVAPELRSEGADVLPSADVFSLGVMVAEMVCGERPNTVRNVRAELPVNDLPQPVQLFLRAALEASPDRRFATPTDLLNALRELCEDPLSTPSFVSAPHAVEVAPPALPSRAAPPPPPADEDSGSYDDGPTHLSPAPLMAAPGAVGRDQREAAAARAPLKRAVANAAKASVASGAKASVASAAKAVAVTKLDEAPQTQTILLDEQPPKSALARQSARTAAKAAKPVTGAFESKLLRGTTEISTPIALDDEPHSLSIVLRGKQERAARSRARYAALSIIGLGVLAAGGIMWARMNGIRIPFIETRAQAELPVEPPRDFVTLDTPRPSSALAFLGDGMVHRPDPPEYEVPWHLIAAELPHAIERGVTPAPDTDAVAVVPNADERGSVTDATSGADGAEASKPADKKLGLEARPRADKPERSEKSDRSDERGEAPTRQPKAAAMLAAPAAPVAETPIVALAEDKDKFGCPKGMVFVPGGRFAMGSASSDEYHGFSDRLLSSVDVKPFCVDRYEFPNQLGATPTVNVTYKQAKAMCAQAGKRLCQEEEWERACKGPSGARFPYGNEFDAGACNVGDDDHARPVRGAGGSAQCRSGFGVVDMSGNVAELTEGRMGADVTVKGGDAAHPDHVSRCANRSAQSPAKKSGLVGFRCCAMPE